MDRALGFEPRGCGFDSCRGRKIKKWAGEDIAKQFFSERTNGSRNKNHFDGLSASLSEPRRSSRGPDRKRRGCTIINEYKP